MFGGGPFRSLFDDPFFRDPFGQFDAMAQRMFSDPFLTGVPPPYHQFPQPQGRPQLPPVVIEEVQEGDSAANDSAPVVEEPDEDRDYHRSEPQPGRISSGGSQRHAPPADWGMQPFPFQMPQAQQNLGNSGMTSFSYSSSSYSSFGGPRGTSYSSTTTTRMGPGGVRETHQTVRDGRNGQESTTISRGVGGQERVVTRRRDASGREFTEEQLRNLQPEDTPAFEQQWQQQADRSLPRFRGMGLPQNPAQQSGYGVQQRALPSSATGGSGAYGGRRSRHQENGGSWEGAGYGHHGFWGGRHA